MDILSLEIERESRFVDLVFSDSDDDETTSKLPPMKDFFKTFYSLKFEANPRHKFCDYRRTMRNLKHHHEVEIIQQLQLIRCSEEQKEMYGWFLTDLLHGSIAHDFLQLFIYIINNRYFRPVNEDVHHFLGCKNIGYTTNLYQLIVSRKFRRIHESKIISYLMENKHILDRFDFSYKSDDMNAFLFAVDESASPEFIKEILKRLDHLYPTQKPFLYSRIFDHGGASALKLATYNLNVKSIHLLFSLGYDDTEEITTCLETLLHPYNHVDVINDCFSLQQKAIGIAFWLHGAKLDKHFEKFVPQYQTCMLLYCLDHIGAHLFLFL